MVALQNALLILFPRFCLLLAAQTDSSLFTLQSERKSNLQHSPSILVLVLTSLILCPDFPNVKSGIYQVCVMFSESILVFCCNLFYSTVAFATLGLFCISKILYLLQTVHFVHFCLSVCTPLEPQIVIQIIIQIRNCMSLGK